MTQPRAQLISLEDTSFYHCTVRCVRRAFLCGDDADSGRNFDHRKQWLVSRLRFLSHIYAIDICAYAVMSNHYHVVVHIDQARAESWSDEEVVERWLQLYNGSALVDRWLEDRSALGQAELDKVLEIIDIWRKRLYELGWFMRGVNETVARMANKEDECTGRFWEGRFKSQALLDEAALLTCMTYVDLNPIRAGMETTVEGSDFTSIQQRLYDIVKDGARQPRTDAEKKVVSRVDEQQLIRRTLSLDDLSEAPLLAFDGSSHTDIYQTLPFTLADYIQLVDTTGRVIRDDKRGCIAEQLPPLVQQLGINPEQWLDHVRQFGRSYADCVGNREKLLHFAEKHQKRWVKGVGIAGEIYISPDKAEQVA